MCRKMRRLLDQKMEPTLIDLRQSANCLRHRVGCARSVVDQCHLTDQCAWPCGLQHKIDQECRFLLLTTRTSCRPCHLPGKGNRRARAAKCRFLYEKVPQDS